MILVASRLYQSNQDEVRRRDYDVFYERVRVPTKKKLRMAFKEIGFKMTVKMVTAEVLLLTLFFFWIRRDHRTLMSSRGHVTVL